MVDDDAGIREVLGDYLSQHGFVAFRAASASEMDDVLASTPIDLIVLDMMMPGEDGLSVCRRLSGKGAPIVMLSAMSEETDRIVGLELGAADYVGKPCNPRELLARVRAVLRRQETPLSGRSGTVVIFDGGWRLDRVRREITRPDGEAVVLSRSEFALMELLVENAGRIVRREHLLEQSGMVGRDVNERAMDVQISRLRRKLTDGSSKEIIITVRGEGYLFDASIESQH